MPDTYQAKVHGTGAIPSIHVYRSKPSGNDEREPLLLHEYPRRNVAPYAPPQYQDITSVTVVGSAPEEDLHRWQPTINKERREQARTNWLGVFLAFMSGTCFTLSSAAIRALRHMEPLQLLLLRAVVQVVFTLPMALTNTGGVLGPGGRRLLLQLQGIVGGLTVMLLFFSFSRLPLGDATTIIFSSPMFVMILSFIFLREPCGFFRTTVVFLLLSGLVLIAKPPFIFQLGSEHRDNHHYDVLGYACAVTATLFTALNMVVMRKCKDVHFSLVVLQLSAWALVVAVVLLAVLRPHLEVPHGWHEWALVVAVSGFGLAGQVLVAHALSMEDAGRVSITRSMDIILAFLLQVFVFGEIPDWMSVLGATFVLVCVVGMGLEDKINHYASLVP